MGSNSISSVSSTKKVSNLESLLQSLTPNVPLRPVHADCIQIFDKESNPSKMPSNYFLLSDVWNCLEDSSAFGQGIIVTLANGDSVTQHFTPHLSAIHLTGHKKTDQEEGSIMNGSAKATKSWSTNESRSADLLMSSKYNISNRSNLWDVSSGKSSSNDQEFKFFETEQDFERVPFFNKIQELAQHNSDLMTLRSIDLAPTSWMAISWYPIYSIPNDGAKIKDFSAQFITYHKLSSFQQDSSVDPCQEKNDSRGSEARMGKNKNFTMLGHQPLPLYPFGLAAKALIGNVWFNDASDEERYNDLEKAAGNWVHKQKFFHHDYNQFSLHKLYIQGR